MYDGTNMFEKEKIQTSLFIAMAAYRCIGYTDTTAGGKQREVDAALQIKSSNRHKQRMGSY